MVGLVPLLLKSISAGLLVEDDAACLEQRSEGCQIIENSSDDQGVLMMQLLIDNVSCPAPKVYDMRFELDDVEARIKHYPSKISFLNLLNALIAEERDATDRERI